MYFLKKVYMVYNEVWGASENLCVKVTLQSARLFLTVGLSYR